MTAGKPQNTEEPYFIGSTDSTESILLDEFLVDTDMASVDNEWLIAKITLLQPKSTLVHKQMLFFLET